MPSSTKKCNEAVKEKRQSMNTSNGNGSGNGSMTATGSSIRASSRKRKRCETERYSESDLESEFEDCNMNDAIEIEKKLRKVARNNSLSDEEMRKLLQKFVKNEHILALVTLKAEDEMARERKREAEEQQQQQQQQHAVIITDVPSVLKLTRAKARELNCMPGISLPSLNETPTQTGIEALIRAELHSDEDDEEYTFKEEDFISDDDRNTTTSDLDSNPCTPQTPLTAAEESPVKFSADGCFKLPHDKRNDQEEDLRIATRTRSKLCLQETTIEDLQSELVPPDVEQCEQLEHDMTVNDEDWMQFLNDFSKPLNNNLHNDDDDPINDPEYDAAAEKEPLDAEELRDVNISKKELTDLVSELFEGLIKEGVCLESIDLETPQKYLENNTNCQPIIETPNKNAATAQEDDARMQASRQINFDTTPINGFIATENPAVSNDAQQFMSNTNPTVTHCDYTFNPNVMSTPSANVAVPVATANAAYAQDSSAPKMVTIPGAALHTEPELIAIPVPGLTNCYQLAKVIANSNETLNQPIQDMSVTQPPTLTSVPSSTHELCYAQPYDSNFTWEYISVRKHIYAEYLEKFEMLRNLKPTSPVCGQTEQMGFTSEQHEMLQQQLRIHVQLMTQTFLQTYSHPQLFGMAKKPKEMLQQLQQRAQTHATFNAWNLNDAIALIDQWEADLCSDLFKKENAEMMDFIHKEIELTNSNTRQVTRLPPRIMHRMLDSTVFMYPQYLPRMGFSPKTSQFTVYSPAEYQLLAIGLEKHLTQIREGKRRIHKSACPIRCACKSMAKDTVHGKLGTRLYEKVRELRDAKQYNPVKYYFEHQRAPPVEQIIFGFERNTVLPPRERYEELPRAWKYFVDKNPWQTGRRPPIHLNKTNLKASAQASTSYLEFVREAIGEDIPLLENFVEIDGTACSVTSNETIGISEKQAAGSRTQTTTGRKSGKRRFDSKERRRIAAPSSLTINVNYIFGGADTASKNLSGISVPFEAGASGSEAFQTSVASLNRSLCLIENSQALSLPPPLPPIEPNTPVVDFRFDPSTGSVQPVTPSLETEAVSDENSDAGKSIEETRSVRSNLSAKYAASGGSSRSRYAARRARNSLIRQAKHFANNRSFCNALRKRQAQLKAQTRRKLQRRCRQLVVQYRGHLQRTLATYAHCAAVQHFHTRFYALELYTRLLTPLKMFCRAKTSSTPTTPKRQRNIVGGGGATSGDDGSVNGKNSTTTNTNAARSRKTNRQEENLRHMLQPDSAEESDRKDAIFAFNFYEKVEECLTAANRGEDFKKFSNLLKNFEPESQTAADLYLQVEQLLLPDHPELAEVFLNFLLPSEATQIGKFFEHFMITNGTAFISKLNVYFNKQPAQIRKIYACLGELAEQPNVSMKQVEAKILPLLRGNQFLIDWFMQQFPSSKPPERLLPSPETINLNEVGNNLSGEFMETVSAHLLVTPSQQQQQLDANACQLKYINGRIFYGSKILLPAKLTFLANTLYNDKSPVDEYDDDLKSNGAVQKCAHSVRTFGEKLLKTATAMESALEGNSDDNIERSEEDHVSATLIVDNLCDEEANNYSALEVCDEAAQRAHAVRLNPSYYPNFNTAASATSTPNVGSNQQAHNHGHAKKTSINFGGAGCGDADMRVVSPRKNSLTNSPMAGITPLSTGCSTSAAAAVAAAAAAANASSYTAGKVDKRKSPTKKGRSPVGVGVRQTPKATATATVTSIMRSATTQPMVVIHEQHQQHTSPAIACAKRLKTLIDAESSAMDAVSAEEVMDNKASVRIIAMAKVKNDAGNNDSAMPPGTQATLPKAEAFTDTDDDESRDFLAISPESLSQRIFPAFKMDMDTSEEEPERALRPPQLQPLPTLPPQPPLPPPQLRNNVITTQFDSDEDCKLDVVATLANCPEVICADTARSSPALSTATASASVATVGTNTATAKRTPTTSAASHSAAWIRDEDKIILIEMKVGASDRGHLLQRIRSKLPRRTLAEITARHQFLMDFLSKLQGKT